jgi:hypothetical protein
MRRIVTVSIGFLLLLGCGESGPPTGLLTGTIKYKDQPVNDCYLLLSPNSDTGKSATVHVSHDGTFRSKVPLGDYTIVVQPFEGMVTHSVDGSRKSMTEGMSPEKAAEAKALLDKTTGGSDPTIPFPDKYKNKEKTDLKCTVTTGQQELTLVLKD